MIEIIPVHSNYMFLYVINSRIIKGDVGVPDGFLINSNFLDVLWVPA